MNDRGLTASALGEMCGSRGIKSQLIKIQNGQMSAVSFTVDSLLLLSQALNVDIKDLLEDTQLDYSETNTNALLNLKNLLTKRSFEDEDGRMWSFKYARSYVSVSLIEETDGLITIHLFRFRVKNNYLDFGNYYKATVDPNTLECSFGVRKIIFDTDLSNKANLSEAVLDIDVNFSDCGEMMKLSQAVLENDKLKFSDGGLEVNPSDGGKVVKLSNRDKQTVKLCEAVLNNGGDVERLPVVFETSVKLFGSLSDFDEIPKQKSYVLSNDEIASGTLYPFLEIAKSMNVLDIAPSDFYDLSREAYRPIVNGTYEKRHKQETNKVND